MPFLETGLRDRKRVDSTTIITETPRLQLREYQADDVMALHVILSDPITMQFWPAPFTPEATSRWIERQMSSYAERGYENHCS